MPRILQTMLLVTLAFVVIVVVCCVPPPADSGAIRTPEGGEYHWTMDSFPLPVAVDPKLSPMYKASVHDAIDMWNTLVRAEVFYYFDAPQEWPMFFRNGGFNRPGYVSVEQGVAGRGSNGELRAGYASLFLYKGPPGARGEIHSVQILLDKDLTTRAFATKVAAHELGHAVGLAHDANDPNSLMWFSALRDNQRIQPEDLAYVRSQLMRGDVSLLRVRRHP